MGFIIKFIFASINPFKEFISALYILSKNYLKFRNVDDPGAVRRGRVAI